jgi:hypothetical protein
MDPELLAQLPDALPAPPVTGYAGWWDASDLASISQAGIGAATWRDKTAAARHFTQATDANRPYTGSRSQAGRNVLWTLGKVTAMQGSVPLTSQPFWVFLVAANLAADAVQRTAFSGYYSAGVEWGRVYRPTSNAIAIYAGGGVTSGAAWEAGRPRVVSALFNGAGSQLNVDGRYSSSGTVGGNGNSTSQGVFGLGLSESWYGWLGELIVYDNRALNAAEVQRVESYLRTKWGLT